MTTNQKIYVEDGKVFILKELRKDNNEYFDNHIDIRELFHKHAESIKKAVQKRINACIEDLTINGYNQVINDGVIVHKGGCFVFSSYENMLYLVNEWNGDIYKLNHYHLYQLIKSFVYIPFIKHSELEVLQTFILSRIEELVHGDDRDNHVGDRSHTVLRTTKVALVNGDTIEIESR